MQETLASNGLGDYTALANLTAVGAFVIVFVGGFFWAITRGLPRAFALVSELMATHLEAQEQSRTDFITALNSQAAARSESAKGGHDAAMRIADNVHDLTEEVRRLRDDRRQPAASNGRLGTA